MNKNTQILLGVGILGVGGYLYWKSTQKPKTTAKMVGANGKIFKSTPKQKVFSADGTAKPLPKQFFNKQGSGWLRGADGQIFKPASNSKVFANMVQPMGTQNCGHTGSWNC